MSHENEQPEIIDATEDTGENHTTHHANHDHKTHNNPTHHQSTTHHTSHKSSNTTSAQSSAKKAWQAFLDFINDIEKLGDEYLLEKAPFAIPQDIKEFIVKAAPYITILWLIISLPVILALLWIGVMAAFVPVAGIIVFFSMALTAIGFVLQAMAIKPLFARARKWWLYTFYAWLLSFLAAVLHGSIIGPIIWWIVGMYILFQVKSYYK